MAKYQSLIELFCKNLRLDMLKQGFATVFNLACVSGRVLTPPFPLINPEQMSPTVPKTLINLGSFEKGSIEFGLDLAEWQVKDFSYFRLWRGQVRKC